MATSELMAIIRVSSSHLSMFFVNELLRRLQGLSERPLYGPKVLNLEISRACNLDCPMCLRSLLPRSERTGFMPLEDLKKVLNNTSRSVIGIGIGGWGEPLLHPNFLEALKLMESKGFFISFDTNGLLLKDYASELVKIRTLYHVGISFDFIPGTIDKAHSIAEALEGAQLLVEAKKREGRRYPLVRVTATLMRSNISILPELVKLVARYGLKWLDCHEAMVFDRAKLNSPWAPPPREELVQYFTEAQRIGQQLGVKVTYGRKRKRITERTPKHYASCRVLWDSVFVDFQGYVHPCCYHLSLSLGDLRTQSLSSTWKNREYTLFRSELLKFKEPFCLNCMKGLMYQNFSAT